MKKFMMASAMSIAMATLTGCLAPKGVGLWIDDGRIGVEDASFAKNLLVESASSSRTPDGFLVANVSVRNANKSDFAFEYRFEWKDAAGTVQRHAAMHWRPMVIHGRDTEPLEGTSPLQGTEGYILKFRRPGAARD